MTFAEHAFASCARKGKELGRRLNKDEWLEAVQAAYDSYPHAGLIVSGPKPKKVQPKADEEDWLAALEQNPAYAGIDIRRELGKAQAWASVRGVGISQRRFINWLNKAMIDRPIQYSGAGKTSFAPAQPQAPSEPAGWREWVRDNSTDPANADKPWSALDASAQKYIISQLNAPAVHPTRPSPRPVLDRQEVPDEDIPVARQKDAGTLLVGSLLQGYR